MVTLKSKGAQALAAMGVFLALAGCQSAAPNDTFGLQAGSVTDGTSARNRQVLVTEPQALKALDSEQIVVRVSPSEIQYLAGSRWSDRLPKLVQSKLVESFENSGKLGGVGKPGEGLAIDFQIVTEIRSFEIQTGGQDAAIIEISAKILNDRTGAVKAQKVFRSIQPTAGSDKRAFVAALNAAFGKMSNDIVNWTLKSI